MREREIERGEKKDEREERRGKREEIGEWSHMPRGRHTSVLNNHLTTLTESIMIGANLSYGGKLQEPI